MLVYFLRLRPTNSLSDSLPFETVWYGIHIFTVRPSLARISCTASRFFSLSILVFSKLYRREIYFRPSCAKPPSPTLSASSNTLLSSLTLSHTHTFSPPLLFTASDLRSATKPDFRRRAHMDAFRGTILAEQRQRDREEKVTTPNQSISASLEERRWHDSHISHLVQNVCTCMSRAS